MNQSGKIMDEHNFHLKGLSAAEVLASRTKFGKNTLDFKRENGFLDALRSLVKEPMILLLLAVSAIYFILGENGDGIFLMSAVLLVAFISLYQDSRSRNALDKLKNYTQTKCKVIREGTVLEIPNAELVVGDYLVIEEGTAVTADGRIIQSNDFSVNESVLTGESMSVFKDTTSEDNQVFSGSLVATGLAVVEITEIGLLTKLGKIGKSLESIQEEKTPLELQINSFVKKMVIAGGIIFLVVWGINFVRTENILESLLKAFTLAMSILPEEIPVAFTTFMALGAWRLMKLGIVVKQMKTVETLGSATVICTDKTGTLTENKMSLARLYSWKNKAIVSPSAALNDAELELLTLAMWASEPAPFDPMEVALHSAYAELLPVDLRGNYHMIHEYPLGGRPPMMTHLFEDKNGDRIIVAKGAAEAIMVVSGLSVTETLEVEAIIKELATAGFRVLGVGKARHEGKDFPETQQEFKFDFKGLVAFYDPPKDNIKEVLQDFYNAGLAVKIITGDNAATTGAIAKQIEFRGSDKSISGDELMKLSDAELRESVMDFNIFTRMYPEAKLRIIEALKAQHQIVAMTGDGVNDGPALKAAHIGIAMGTKGTEIAKQAASLILVEDDLAKMVDAIAMGRKIYTNLKKAIQYIISIHIPIILTVFIPLALGWIYPNIFSPIHVIMLELIMGPTCSIIYENEPMEKDTMVQQPRPFNATFFSRNELLISIVQGLMITVGTLVTYQFAVQTGLREETTRAMVFSTLIFANVFLTLVNRSFYYSIFTTLNYKNYLVPLIISVTLLVLLGMLYVHPVAAFFGFARLTLLQLNLSAMLGFFSVMWFELYKWYQRSN
jgi:Ca2+-transporting ATPase